MRLSVILLCVFVTNAIVGQPFNFTVYREANGLPSGYVEQSFEDSRGFLWLCTFGGLSRFDGNNFVNYGIKDGLPSNMLDGITEDNKGRLWIATRNGVSVFNGKDFANYRCAPASETTTYYTYFKKGLDGNIYISVANCLYKIVNDKVQDDMAPIGFKDSIVSAQQVLANNTKVIATKRNVYLVPKNGKRICYTNLTTTHIVTFFPKDDPRCFYILGTTGVYVWKNNMLQKISALNFDRQILTAFFVDNKKRIWVAAESKGIKIINTITNKIDSITNLPILVTHFFQDRQGTIWISTFRGLVKATERYVTKYDEATGLIAEDIRSSGELPDGRIFMNINIINNGKITDYSSPIKIFIKQRHGLTTVSAMAVDNKKDFWIFSYFGKTYKLVNGHFIDQTKKIGKIFTSSAFYNNADSSIMLASDNQILFLKNDTIIKKIDGLANGIKFQDVKSIKNDYFGNTWISDNNKILLLTNKKIIDFTPALQLPSGVNIFMAYSDSTGCWFITKGYGIFHFKHNIDGSFKKDIMLDKAHGLSNDNILSITLDERNHLWVATLNGLCYVNLNKPKLDGGFTVSMVDGNEGIDVPNWNMAFLEKDTLGNIWLGVGNGIYELNARKLKISNIPPSIQIDQVLLLNGNKTIENALGEQNYFQLPQKTSLSYDDNNISFSFKGINLRSGNVKYAYVLEGQNNATTISQVNGSVTYNNLPPGTYCFKVKAINDYGLESSKAAEFNFIIRPPFWQTWWFRLLIAIISIALIYLFVKQRDKAIAQKGNLQLQMSELKLQAVQSQMNPHFIFNSLNSIQNFIVQNNQIEAARYLSRFSKLIRRILDNSHHQFLKLEEVVETLKMYVELEAFRFNKEFSYAFNIDSADERIYDAELPPMLLQPFVENAILHGLMPKEGDKHLTIDINIKNEMLQCIIEDNGIGRKEKVKTDHISRGEKLTRSMLDSIKLLQDKEASIIYEDLKNIDQEAIGTRVTIQIPLSKN